MFSNNTFVRVRRRSDTVLTQIIILGAAFFVCLIGAVAFLHFSSPTGNAATLNTPEMEQAGTVEIIVPIDNIEAGLALAPEMFRRDRRPEVVVSPEMVRDLEDLKGLYSRGLLVAGQPIHRDFLTSLQPVNALTASIPTGYRAIAIPVDATSSVEGWAQAGARVDVVWVTSVSGQKTASILAPNAKVLSANRQTEANQTDDPQEKAQDEQIPSTVTLLLTNRDSLRVRLAALNGRLSLVLRGSEDPGAVTSTGVIRENDITKSYNPAEAPAPRNLVTVTVRDRKTGSTEDMTFENGERIRE